MKKSLLCVAILSTLFFSNVKLNAARKNLEVLDSLAGDIIIQLEQNYLLNSNIGDTIRYKIVGEAGDWLIERKLLELEQIELEQKKQRILLNTANNSKAAPDIKIIIENIGVSFNSLEKNIDSVVRFCEIKLSVISNFNNSLSKTSNIEINNTDTLHFNDINQVNRANFGFAIGIVPDRKRNFFEKIIEPVVVVAAVAITTFLFFSVRSK